MVPHEYYYKNRYSHRSITRRERCGVCGEIFWKRKRKPVSTRLLRRSTRRFLLTAANKKPRAEVRGFSFVRRKMLYTAYMNTVTVVNIKCRGCEKKIRTSLSKAGLEHITMKLLEALLRGICGILRCNQPYEAYATKGSLAFIPVSQATGYSA